MGLFDSLKKLTENIGKEINESGIKDDLSKFGKDMADGFQSLADTAKDDLKGKNKESDKNKIPEEYSEFPTFSRNPDRVNISKTWKYKRCSMVFYNATEDEIKDYTYLITSRGYIQNSKVRYDKENTYIIVDPEYSNGLNIVFHIKK